MGITIQTRLITKKPKDLSESIMIPATNAIVEGLQKELTARLSEIECENCKEQTRGTITITADLTKRFSIQKSGFCCQDFQESININ